MSTAVRAARIVRLRRHVLRAKEASLAEARARTAESEAHARGELARWEATLDAVDAQTTADALQMESAHRATIHASAKRAAAVVAERRRDEDEARQAVTAASLDLERMTRWAERIEEQRRDALARAERRAEDEHASRMDRRS